MKGIILTKYLTHFAVLVVLMNYGMVKNNLFAVEYHDNYRQDPKYGNGQSSGFINTMYGGSSELPAKEQQMFNHAKYQTNKNKYFVRIGVAYGTDSLTNIKNHSTNVNFADIAINKDNYKIRRRSNIELAMGYKLQEIYGEIECLAIKKLDYDISPLFKTNDGGLSGDVKSKVLLFNAYYDIFRTRLMYICLGVGLGVGFHNINFAFNNIDNIISSNLSKKRFSAAYNLLFGCKFQIVSQMFLQVSVRYTDFTGSGKIRKISTGNLTWEDSNKDLIIKSDRKFVGVSFNFVHIFL